jgi:molecular chaperone GrpE (heat shock protein)
MKKQPPAIGEMMLAKTVLEEKNEELEAKDRRLRELTSRLRDLTEDVEQLQAELEASAHNLAEARRGAFQEGADRVIEEVVGVLADWGPEAPKLTEHLLAVLRERHGLELIEEVPGRLDPRLHRVLEVSRLPQAGTQVLTKGFRLGGRVLRPALVRVGLAADPPPSA